MRPPSESLSQSRNPVEEKHSAAFRQPPSLSFLPNTAKELDFGKNITHWVWTAVIPTASSVCSPNLPVVFAHEAPWGGVAGCHTLFPCRPAPAGDRRAL